MAKVFAAGYIVKDAELRTFPSGENYALFTIAENQVYTKDGQKQQKTTYIPCKIPTWGPLSMVPYLTKGRGISLEGLYENYSYVKGGVEIHRTEVLVTNGRDIQLFSQGKKGNDADQASSGDYDPSRPYAEQYREAQAASSGGLRPPSAPLPVRPGSNDPLGDLDDDIPF